MNELDSQKKRPSRKRTDWHVADIKAAVEKAGWRSLRQLSKANGLGPGTVKDALAKPYPNAERIIAKAIGVEPMEIWPSRYHADGTPNRIRTKRSTVRFDNRKSTRNGGAMLNGKSGGAV